MTATHLPDGSPIVLTKTLIDRIMFQLMARGHSDNQITITMTYNELVAVAGGLAIATTKLLDQLQSDYDELDGRAAINAVILFTQFAGEITGG